MSYDSVINTYTNMDAFLYSLRVPMAASAVSGTTQLSYTEFFKALSIDFVLNTYSLNDITRLAQGDKVKLQTTSACENMSCVAGVQFYRETEMPMTSFLPQLKQSISKSLVLKDYLNSVMLAASSVQFSNFMNMCQGSLPPMKERTSVIMAKYYISMVPSVHRFSIIDQISKKIQKVILEIIKANTLPSNIIIDFTQGTPSSAFYYMLWKTFLSQYKLPDVLSYVKNDEHQLFIKSILIDVYIKACYPLLITQIMQAFIDMYTERGDFVNIRIASLAQIMYVYNFVYHMQNRAPSNINTAILSQIKAQLNDYIIKLSADNKELKAILDVSKSAAETGQNTVFLRESISKTQNQMRNSISSIDQYKHNYQKRKAMFIVLLVLCLFEIAICTLLLILNYNTGVYYVAGILAIFALITKLVTLVAR